MDLFPSSARNTERPTCQSNTLALRLKIFVSSPEIFNLFPTMHDGAVTESRRWSALSSPLPDDAILQLKSNPSSNCSSIHKSDFAILSFDYTPKSIIGELVEESTEVRLHPT